MKILIAVAILNDDHFVDAGEGHQGARRNSNRGIRLIRNDLSFHKCAGPQAAVVTHVGFDGQHAILFADRGTKPLDVTKI